MITREPVLVLNQNYQPLNICNVRRAVVLLGRGKAELMKNGRGHIQGVSWTIPLPSVIRMMYQVRRPLIRRRLSRRAVFYRDGPFPFTRGRFSWGLAARVLRQVFGKAG